MASLKWLIKLGYGFDLISARLYQTMNVQQKLIHEMINTENILQKWK